MSTQLYQPGQRVRVTQQVPRLERDGGGPMVSTVEGTVVAFGQQKTGSWYAHSRDHKLWMDRLLDQEGRWGGRASESGPVFGGGRAVGSKEDLMTISFDLPPDIEKMLPLGGQDPGAAVKEAALVEHYRQGQIVYHQLSHALGLSR